MAMRMGYKPTQSTHATTQGLKVLGKLIINVSYEKKICNRLPLYIIKGSVVNLLGRNWMALMRLNL